MAGGTAALLVIPSRTPPLTLTQSHDVPQAPPRPITHRAVLAIALPIVAANISTPLIGIVDTAIIGQLGDAYYIGAIAIGALIFNFLYWAFAFLRMGTTGFTAQAAGAGDADEMRAVLGRALLVAAGAGVALVVLQGLIGWASFEIIDASADVERHAQTYFAIRIWSAPAALFNFAVLGWFIGLGRTGLGLSLQLVLNITNIVLDAVFVLWLDMGVSGVALGTVIAELTAAGAGAIAIRYELGRRGGDWDWARIRDPGRLRHTMAVNGDILVRTLCVLFAFSFFTAQSAKEGDIVLAANTVLMNLVSLSSYLLDGFAYAAETLAGQALGARSRARFHRAVIVSSLWSGVIAVIVCLIFFVFGQAMIDAMTVNEEVRETARTYLFWAAISPVVGVACFQLDGVYIGATRTRDMRNYMLLSVVLYLVAWWTLTPVLGNHGLWIAIMVLLSARGVTLGYRYPALLRDLFGNRDA